ncbi:MAG: hypothetical protein L7H18_00380 [Candidatus Nealsonbacteria bacterium DGGOD1a]|jgi:hypothetical protein|nr:MAG: hypothetical protein L7H18_00380 [Candidatus Nealsonbacteria bacterium DGGOD1a]
MGNVLKNNPKAYLQIITFAILLFVFYKLGFPSYFIVGMGIFILLLILLKGKLFNKIDSFLTARLPFLSKQSPRVKKLIIAIAFVIAYIFLKQIAFFVLSRFGVDVQKIIMDGVNNN